MSPATPEPLPWITQLVNCWVKIPNQIWLTLCPEPMALPRLSPGGHTLGKADRFCSLSSQKQRLTGEAMGFDLEELALNHSWAHSV